MSTVVLLIEEDDGERVRLRQALQARRLLVHEVREAVDAMGVIGRIDFSCVIAGEAKRRLSLRGLCQLALRKHPDIQFLVRGRAGSEAEVRENLGVAVQVVPTGMAPVDVVSLLLDALAARAAPSDEGFDDKTAPVDYLGDELDAGVGVDVDVELDVDVDDSPSAPAVAAPSPAAAQRTRSQAPPQTAPPKPAPPRALFEGELAPGSSSALLMGVFAQDLTGVLELFGGPAAGRLYFYAGEPVAAEHPDGDAYLRELLTKKGVIPNGFQVAAPEGQLLSKLIERQILGGQAVHDVLVEFVRERTLALAMQEAGAYRFLEDMSFVSQRALVKVNPFALIFEACRRRTPPSELLRESSANADLIVVGQPALRVAAPKLRQYVRGQDLRELLAEPRTVQELLDAVGLDALIGTLVVSTLVAARLVLLTDEPPEPSQLMAASDQRGMASLPEADPIEDDEDDEDAHPSVREEIFTLYMRLKPLTRYEEVLGVELGADSRTIERAFEERMRALDPVRIPEGSARRLLISRVEELREKVRIAHDALLR